MVSGGRRSPIAHGGGRATTRRACVALGVTTGIGLLVGCTRRGSDARLATTERAVLAPGGEVEALLVADGDELRPTIRDLDGNTLWTDERAHVERQRPGVLWEQDADVLWVLSSDLGTVSVRGEADGSWVSTPGTDGMPEDIAEIAGL